MAAALKPQSDGAGVGTQPPGVAQGESPTEEIGADATLAFAPAAEPKLESHETAATVSLPAGAMSAFMRDVDAPPTTAILVASEKRKAAVSSPPSSVGRKIGPYTVQGELGRGGMGVVYLARHEQLGRTVALKMILSGNQAGEEAHQRFLVEAQSIARLSHPGIVTVYDIGENEGMPYFSLEYIPGESLSRLIAEKPLEPQAAAALVAKMATAMQYAHDKGVLHRDLKPANVLMADGETPKITDFGLAKQIEGAQDAELTQAGSIMGTPSYMSPEQAGGDPDALGPATDQYSLGAILYQLLTGRAPFVAPRAFEVIRQVLADEPVAPRKLSPQVPADLETICLKAMHKDSTRRYASCQELAADLTRFLEGRPILARPVSTQERLVRWCRRNPVIAATSGTALAAVLTALAVVSWSSYTLSQKNTALKEAYGELETANQTVQSTNTQLEKTNGQLKGANDQLGKQNILLDERYQEAEAAKKLAYDRAKLANNSFRFVIDKARDSLGGIPQLRDFRKELILSALEGLEKLPDDPADKIYNRGLQKAKAEEYLYQTYLHVGEPSQAVPHIEIALAILRDRENFQGGTDATRFNLASCLLAKAQARQSFERDMNLSTKCSGESLTLLESIVAVPNPKEFDLDKGSMDALKVRELLLRSRNIHTAALWQQGRIAEALLHARRNVEILDETFKVIPQLKNLPADQKRNVRAGMAWIHQLRAVTALRAGEMKEAEEQQMEALDLARLSVKISGGAWDARRALAEILGFTGDFYVAKKDDVKARQAYEEAARLAREIYAQDGTSEQGRNALNIELIRLAGFEKTRGTDKHQKLYQEALEVARLMVKSDPKGQTHQVALALSLAPTGAHAEAKEVADRLLAGQKKPDAELFIDMARVYSQCSAAAGLKETEVAAYQQSALDCLAKAVDQGYRDQVYLTSHPDFVPLKDAQTFLDLLKKISTSKGS
jgi:serine/threonine protein kinase